jgi:hypothetical protein
MSRGEGPGGEPEEYQYLFKFAPDYPGTAEEKAPVYPFLATEVKEKKEIDVGPVRTFSEVFPKLYSNYKLALYNDRNGDFAFGEQGGATNDHDVIQNALKYSIEAAFLEKKQSELQQNLIQRYHRMGINEVSEAQLNDLLPPLDQSSLRGYEATLAQHYGPEGSESYAALESMRQFLKEAVGTGIDKNRFRDIAGVTFENAARLDAEGGLPPAGPIKPEKDDTSSSQVEPEKIATLQ